MPLDSEGFLRRECPHCSKAFKWHHGESDEGSAMELAGYHCPYCNGQSVDGWWTVAQLAAIEDETKFFAERKIHETFKGLERNSNQFVKFRTGSAPTRMNRPPLTEPEDMRRVTSACHRSEPVKVLEEWSGPVHCLVCGQAAA